MKNLRGRRYLPVDSMSATEVHVRSPSHGIHPHSLAQPPDRCTIAFLLLVSLRLTLWSTKYHIVRNTTRFNYRSSRTCFESQSFPHHPIEFGQAYWALLRVPPSKPNLKLETAGRLVFIRWRFSLWHCPLYRFPAMILARMRLTCHALSRHRRCRRSRSIFALLYPQERSHRRIGRTVCSVSSSCLPSRCMPVIQCNVSA